MAWGPDPARCDWLARGALLLVASSRTGLEVIDVHNPAAPVPRGRLDFPARALAVQARERYAYVGLTRGFAVVDLDDLGQPGLVAMLDPFGGYGVTALGMSATHLVGGSEIGQFFMADLRDAPGISPFRPSLFLQIGLGGGLEVVDVREPARPRRIGVAEAPGNTPRVRVFGNWAYVLSWDGADSEHLRRFDISDPTAPRFDSEMTYPVRERIVTFAVDASIVAVLVDESGQGSVDLSYAGRPLEPLPRLRIGRPYPSGPSDLALRNGFVHLVYEFAGYEVLDVRPLLFPRWVMRQPAWHGGLLRVTDGELWMGHGLFGGLSILRGLPGIGAGLVVSELEPGREAVLEWSERFGPGADWRELARRTPTGSTFELVDPAGGWGGAAARFYRVRL